MLYLIVIHIIFSHMFNEYFLSFLPQNDQYYDFIYKSLIFPTN